MNTDAACHTGGEKLQADVRSIYQSITMLWFFTPHSPANQVLPILTTTEFTRPLQTTNTKQRVLELSSSIVSGLHAKLLLKVTECY